MFLKRFFNSPSTLASGVKDKIKEAIKSALLAKDSPRVGTLKLLQADIINFEKSGAGTTLIKLVFTVLLKNDVICCRHKRRIRLSSSFTVS